MRGAKRQTERSTAQHTKTTAILGLTRRLPWRFRKFTYRIELKVNGGGSDARRVIDIGTRKGKTGGFLRDYNTPLL